MFDNSKVDLTQFDAKVDSFVVGCQDIINKYFSFNYPATHAPTLEKKVGQRYVKVIRRDHGNRTGGSVHVFVDRLNGDVLKAASYAAPAKHARGNIFDEHNGLSRMSCYGAEYLR